MPAHLAPPLSWVKPEIDYSLKSVRDSIALYIAKPKDITALRKCPEQLHQVTGALNILGLNGAVGFCESMELAFTSVTASPAIQPSVLGTLDSAVVALKEFIDGLAKGAINAPIKLFQVYRELSSLHGKSDASEKDLFFPDLATDVPVHPAAATVPMDNLPAALLAQRTRFQRGLLAVLRNPAAQDGLKDMRGALEALDALSAQLPPPRSLWWTAIGLIDGLLHAAGNEPWEADVKMLCGKLDLRIRDLARGETPKSDQLLRDVLFAIAKCKAASPRIRDIKQLYQLDSLFPESDIPGLMEFDMDWLGPALNEVQSRVQSIKDVWVQYVSGEAGALQALRDSLTALKAKIHDLGNVPMIRIIDVITIVSTRLPNPYPRPSQLMITEMASAFLLIEKIVDHFTDAPPDLHKQVEIMGGWLLDSVKGTSPKPIPEGLRDDLSEEISRLKLQTQVAKEIAINLQHIEQVLDAFVRDGSKINTLPSLSSHLKQIHGALLILGFNRAAEVQSMCNRLIAKCTKANPAWTEHDMDTIVEGLSSLGFYLDPCLRGLPPATGALDVFFERLAQRHAALQPADAANAQPESTPPKQPIAADQGEQLAAVGTPDTVDPQSAPSVAVSDELLDIFLEEAQEVLAAVGAALPVCRADSQNIDALTIVRRGFHTLKGSGRMVGLNDLGEVAWDAEQVMNLWLDRQWPATPALLEMIEFATTSFSTWIVQLQAKQPLAIDAQQLNVMAAALKAATAPVVAPALVAAPVPVPTQETDEIVIGTASVSKAFFDIYRKEAQQHLSTLNTEIRVLCESPGGDATGPLELAAHTLASISRTAGLLPLAELAMRLEQCLPIARLITQPDDLQLLRRTVASLGTMLDSIVQLRQPDAADDLVAELDALMQRLYASQSLPPEPAVEVDDAPSAPPSRDGVSKEQAIEPAEDALVRAAAIQTLQDKRAIRDDLDPHLLPIFLEEAMELLPQISRDLRAWKAAPGDPHIPQALQRALHTLKGSARMAGAMRLGELSHLMETRVDAAVASGTPAMALLEDIEGHIDRLAAGVESLRIPETPAPTPQHAPDLSPGAAPVTSPEHPDIPLQQGTALLRIHANSMDRLINEAGEVGIARSRIEGELRNIKQSLLELNDSMMRLKGQLREVEMQADSQMQSRQSLVSADRPEFDPLEFDRYTRLQELTRMMSESMHDVTTVQQTLLHDVGEIEAAVLQQARSNRELQQGLMRTRTMPFANLDERLYRVARQTARELDKKINLEIIDSHIELDRSVLDRIGAPLEHLLRNAIGHGIEAPGLRLAAGKPETGEISITLRQESNEIAIIIHDDGAGLNFEKLRAKGIDRGLLDPQHSPSNDELVSLIFLPGFSTAEMVTEVSGRGVGMDVVHNEVTAIGGHIETTSEAGKGLAFSIFLPLTLAVAQAILVRAAAGTFAITSTMIEQVLSLRPDQLAAARGHGSIEQHGLSYPMHTLQQLLGYTAPAAVTQGYSSVLLLRSGLQRIALFVEGLTRNQEIVIKPVNTQLARVPGITGATVLGDGRVVLIINPVQLAHRLRPLTGDIPAEPPEEALAPTTPLVMVVDDSLTVRKITGRLLEREGYRVATATDGLDALEQMNDVLPDVMLVDIEMPRMDGFDLSTRVRQDARTAAIPIIIISSRTAEKHRNRAQALGVNAFLGKPYQEAELLLHVAKYIRSAH